MKKEPTEEQKLRKKEYNKKYRKENKETIKIKQKEYDKLYYETNKNKIKEDKKEYYKKWRQLNKEKLNQDKKEWAKNNPEKTKEIKTNYYKSHKKEIKEYGRKYYIEKNKGKQLSVEQRNKKNKRIRERKNTDSLFKLRHNISNNISHSLKKGGYTKKSRTHEILGCSFEFFKSHIESLWKPWMNWNNYGKYNGELNFGWDFDHIIPLSTALTEGDIIKLNRWINFQPLCSKVNRDIKKDNTILVL